MSVNRFEGTDIIIINMDDIVLGDRIRTVQNDEMLKSLKASIEKDGLLQPIVINQENKLIAGYRRYTSCKELGYTTIQAKIINTKDDLHEKLLEIKENVDRKAFTFSEKMKAAKTIEPIIRELAEQRVKLKKESDLSHFGIAAKRGKTRDFMAEILGFGSGKTYDKGKYIWEAKDEEIIASLDEGKQTISRAYNRIRQKNKPPCQPTTNARVDDILFELGNRIDNNNYTYNELKKIRNILHLLKDKIEEQLEKSSLEYKIKNKWQ